MTVPDMLSVDPDFPGFRSDAALVGADLEITLNGVIQKHVIAYDVPGRTLVRVRTDTEGKVSLTCGEIELETLHGEVAVSRKQAA